MAVHKYNPKKITGSWVGKIGSRPFAVQLSGYMDSSFVNAEYDEDQATKHIGAQGEASVVLNCNRGAKLVATFVQGASVNNQLSLLVPNGKKNYLPVGVLTLVDLNGTTVFKAAEAWLTKPAKVEFAKDITGREWTWDTGDADIIVGGSADA